MAAPATASVIKSIEELGPNMQLQDLRTQAAARVNLVLSIENKYDGPITNNEDAAAVERYTKEAIALETRSLFLFIALWTSQHWILATGLA